MTTDSEPSEHRYSTDRPILSREGDRFDRWPFAGRIAETLRGRSDISSLVVGLYGPWGDGKTSILNLMAEELKGDSDVVIVRFNPWYFRSEEQLVAAFFAAIAGGFGKTLPKIGERAGRILHEYGSLLSLASVTVGGVVQFAPGTAVQDLGKRLSEAPLETLRDRVEKLLVEEKQRIIVLIDDIDRLDPQEIQAIFKLVKLSADFPYTSYVLAFDDEVVVDALGAKYRQGQVEAGRRYLDKIIQVPLHLPAAEQLALRQFCFEGVQDAVKLAGLELTEQQAQEFVSRFEDGLEVRLATPRQARRYVNALTFALPLLRGEVHPVDQMLVEGVRIFYPPLYAAIRENPHVFLGDDPAVRRDDEARMKAQEEVLGPALAGLRSREVKAARKLVQGLFPRAGASRYGQGWGEQWAREQRVAATEYFQRFFQYGIPSRDVPDTSVRHLLELARRGDAAGVTSDINLANERTALPRLVEKLRLQEDGVDPTAAEVLALALAPLGGLLPDDRRKFLFTSTASQAGILVRRLLQRLPTGAPREGVARQVVAAAEPLPFALECFKWIRHTEENEAEGLLSSAVVQELGVLLAGRVRTAAAAQPLYLSFTDNAAFLFWAWREYGSPEEVAAHLEGRFRDHPEETARFLLEFVGTSYGGGRSRKADLREDTYDAVSPLAAPEVILRHLVARYGAGIEGAEFQVPDGTPDEERMARQFAFIHRRRSPPPSASVADAGQSAQPDS